MPSIQHQLSDLILAALGAARAAGDLPALVLPAGIPVTRCPRPEWGDYSSPLALQVARTVGRPPLDVARTVAAYLPPSELLGGTSVTPPGFLNLTLDPTWVLAQVDRIRAAGEGYADLALGGGRPAQVEFVSANPTGPLTVGHGRGGVLGDTLANLLEAVGYRVTREFYYNNAGRQMQLLGESLRARYLQALGEEADLPAGAYRGEYLVATAAELVRTRGETLRGAGWEVFKDLAEAEIAAGQRRTLERLHIRMDVYFNEASLYTDGAVDRTVAALRARGHVYEQDGATWLRLSALGGTEDRVIVRSSGEPTYRLPDIAYHVDKLDRGYDLVIDVLGADHKDAFPDVLRGVAALGRDVSGIRLLMNQFVTFKGERMSKRAGRFTTLDELIDEVGGDVARYFLLLRSPESHLEFDLDLAREHSEKNPVFYVQYAHARICSILRLAAERGFAPGGATTGLGHPCEVALVRRLLDLADVIDVAVRNLAPHLLTDYARDLAADFHAFYRDCRVLDPDAGDLSRGRLNLVEAARVGLARTLGLLGVSAPEQM